MGTLWQPHPTQDQPAPQGGFGIDSRIGAAAPRAPAASRENSRPQAILKFQPCNSFDYRVSYEPQLAQVLYPTAFFIIEISNLWQILQKPNTISFLMSIHTFLYDFWIWLILILLQNKIFSQNPEICWKKIIKLKSRKEIQNWKFHTNMLLNFTNLSF